MTALRAALAAVSIVCALMLPARAAQADRFYSDVRAGDYGRAVPDGAAYLCAHPHDDAFAIDLSYAYLHLNDLAQARAVLQGRGAYFAKHRAAAAVWLALSYRDSDERNYREAIADVDRYLRYDPDAAAAWRQRDLAAAALHPAPTPAAGSDAATSFYQDVAQKRYAEAADVGSSYLAAHPQDAAFAIDLAYAQVNAGRLAAAGALADRYDAYLTANPAHASILAALFYAYQRRGDTERALQYGETYLALVPSDDAVAADVAYAQAGAGHTARARELLLAHAGYLRTHPSAAKAWMAIAYREAAEKRYVQAINATDRYLALVPSDAQARAQRAAFVDERWGGPRQTLFGYVYNDTRFADTFAGIDEAYTLASSGGLRVYAAAHLREDTRSGAPGSPQIYSDDALVADLGIRESLGAYLAAYAEGGAGFGLRGQGTVGDARYGLLYSRGWNGPGASRTSVDASAAVYSRYAGNAIAYYQILHTFTGRGVRPLIGLNGGFDSQRVFGNNYLEGLYGVELGDGRLALRLLGVEGLYLTRGAFPARPAYSSFRAMLVFGIAK